MIYNTFFLSTNVVQKNTSNKIKWKIYHFYCYSRIISVAHTIIIDACDTEKFYRNPSIISRAMIAYV